MENIKLQTTKHLKLLTTELIKKTNLQSRHTKEKKKQEAKKIREIKNPKARVDTKIEVKRQRNRKRSLKLKNIRKKASS